MIAGSPEQTHQLVGLKNSLLASEQKMTSTIQNFPHAGGSSNANKHKNILLSNQLKGATTASGSTAIQPHDFSVAPPRTAGTSLDMHSRKLAYKQPAANHRYNEANGAMQI